MNESENYLSSNIRLLIGLYGLSQRELAKNLEISTSNMNRYCKLELKNVNIGELRKIANFFGTDLETIVNIDLMKRMQEHASQQYNIKGPYNLEGRDILDFEI